MIKRCIYLWLLLPLGGLGGILSSCTERIDINTDNAAPQVVITGYITTEAKVHTVTVAQTVRYIGMDMPKTFSNAKVTINGIPLSGMGDGVYGTDPGFYGEPGKTYRLEVELDVNDDGQLSYYTAEAVMPAMHVLDSVYLRPVFEDMEVPRWMAIVNFMDVKGIPNHFGAHTYINGVKYSNYLHRYFLNENDEKTADGQYIRFPLVPEFILREAMPWSDESDFLVYTDDFLTVELNMMDRPYYEYIRAAKKEIAGSNPVFAGPPANVPGNIQGGALGIFGAYTVSRKSLVLGKEYGFPDRP